MGLEEQEGKGERGEHTRRAKGDPAFLCSLTLGDRERSGPHGDQAFSFFIFILGQGVNSCVVQ